jgi:hypothetical protein
MTKIERERSDEQLGLVDCSEPEVARFGQTDANDIALCGTLAVGLATASE